MPVWLQTVLILLLAVLAFGCGLWFLVPILAGLPWIPSRPERIRRALALARLQSGEILYDLGSGDGRVLVLAAREFGARAVGIEISPLHCAAAWLRARRYGVGRQVRIRRGNFLRGDLSEADVVYAYLTSHETPRLRKRLEQQLRRGARVVTVGADMDGWRPAGFDRVGLVFLYTMPPEAGGLESSLADGRDRQRPQSESAGPPSRPRQRSGPEESAEGRRVK